MMKMGRESQLSWRNWRNVWPWPLISGYLTISSIALLLAGCTLEEPQAYSFQGEEYNVWFGNRTTRIEPATFRREPPCEAPTIWGTCVAAACDLLACDALGHAGPLLRDPYVYIDLDAEAAGFDYYWDDDVESMVTKHILGDYIVERFKDHHGVAWDIEPLYYLDVRTIVPSSLLKLSRPAASDIGLTGRDAFGHYADHIVFGFEFRNRVIIRLEGRRVRSIFVDVE